MANREIAFSSGFRISLIVLVLFHGTCGANDINHHCVPSSCGNIPNISYPFRLKGDPQNCGDPRYELSCENNNLTVSNLYGGNYNCGRYYVEEINYNNYTIRVVDSGMHKGNYSSFPTYSLPSDYFRLHRYTDPTYSTYLRKSGRSDPDLSQSVVFMKCEKPVNSSLYLYLSPCINNAVYPSSNSSKRYTYVTFGTTNTISDVGDSCQVEQIGLTSYWPAGKYDPNISCVDIHDNLANGFELSWLQVYCRNCTGYCYLSDANNIDCYNGGVSLKRYLEMYLGYFRESGPIPILKRIEFIGVYPMAYIEYFFIGLTLIGLYVATKIVLGTPCVVAFLIYKWRKRHLSMYDNVEDFLQSQNNLMPIRYSYSEIKRMAKGFQDKLGEGGYGSVFKGKLRSGRLVAIKMLGKSKDNGQDFINEVATIGRIHHLNVVQLIGFCAEGPKRVLVYDFMPNGSLEKYIFSREGSIPLSVENLYKISLGVACGIEYLHRGCDIQILHFDIKPHNILLDENFTPKVSDFGLAKLYPIDDSIVPLTAARGTLGYIAPELFYKNIGGVSYKADVYSFGMLLMEMANRRKNLNAVAEHSSQIYFPNWVYDQFNEGKDIEIEDATEEEKEIAKKMILVALWCIQMKPNDRPSMNKVVEMLEARVECLQLPGRPFLSSEKTTKDVEDNSSPTSSSIQSDELDSISLISNAN